MSEPRTQLTVVDGDLAGAMGQDLASVEIFGPAAEEMAKRLGTVLKKLAFFAGDVEPGNAAQVTALLRGRLEWQRTMVGADLDALPCFLIRYLSALETGRRWSKSAAPTAESSATEHELREALQDVGIECTTEGVRRFLDRQSLACRELQFRATAREVPEPPSKTGISPPPWDAIQRVATQLDGLRAAARRRFALDLPGPRLEDAAPPRCAIACSEKVASFARRVHDELFLRGATVVFGPPWVGEGPVPGRDFDKLIPIQAPPSEWLRSTLHALRESPTAPAVFPVAFDRGSSQPSASSGAERETRRDIEQELEDYLAAEFPRDAEDGEGFERSFEALWSALSAEPEVATRAG